MIHYNSWKGITIVSILSITLAMNPMLAFASSSFKINYQPRFTFIFDDATANAGFGANIAIDGNTMVVADSKRVNGEPEQSVYVYMKSGGNWVIEKKYI